MKKDRKELPNKQDEKIEKRKGAYLERSKDKERVE